MILKSNLPVNNRKIDLLKKIDTVLFQNKSRWDYGASIGDGLVLKPMGFELFARIKIFSPFKPIYHQVYLNEHDTYSEIRNELIIFRHLVNGNPYIVY